MTITIRHTMMAKFFAAMIVCSAGVSSQDCLHFDSNMGATYDLTDLQRYLLLSDFFVLISSA